MASYAIHLAISELYLKKHSDENYEDFITGTIDVDDTADRIKSHYTGNTDKSNLKRFLTQKVLLDDYVKSNSIQTSYDRGYFLHLLTDYYFYNSYFDEAWINNTEYPEFKRILYHDYHILNGYLTKKYKIKYPRRLKESDYSSEEGITEVLTPELIDQFITFMSNIELDKTYAMIKESQDLLSKYNLGEER